MAGSGLFLSQEQDNRTWREEPLGEFSMASAYKVLNNGGTRMSGSDVIWKTPAPSKVRAFIWLVANDAILTKENLIRRHCPIDDSCVRCQRGIESTEHLFLLCPFSQCIWAVIMNAFGIRTHLLQLRDCWTEWRSHHVTMRLRKT